MQKASILAPDCVPACLPAGLAGASGAPATGHTQCPLPPQAESAGGVPLAHVVESTAAHCFVTVDLDLTAGYVRFFRNGHLIGTAFQGLTGPISPALAFIQVRHARGVYSWLGDGSTAGIVAPLTNKVWINPALP